MATTKKTLVIRAEQTQNPDGSITIRPVEVADDREIGTGEAAKALGVHRDTICLLCDLGEKNGGLSAWKLPSARGNARWRINLQSVLNYKERRIKATMGEWNDL